MSRQLHSKQQASRKLDRRNAIKNIDYDATSSPNRAHSLDVAALRWTSFRVEGVDGDFDQICRSLGLSGPEDFAIPAAAWEARKSCSLAEPSPRGVNDRVSEHIVSCESDDNRNFEKFRVPSSSTDNLFDTFRHCDAVSCELGKKGNLGKFMVPSSNKDNLFDAVRHCDEVSYELANNRNSVSCELASNRNRDKLLQDKISDREYQRNENRFTSGKHRDEVTCELGDYQNLEKFGVTDLNRDDSSDSPETKVEVRETKTNVNDFSQVKKTEFAPAKIKVRVNRTDENRECDEEVSTSIGAGRNRISVGSFRSSGGGIKGTRPPVLAPPPVISTSQKTDDTSSSWDLLRSFGPPSDEDSGYCIASSLQKKKTTTEDTAEVGRRRREADGEWLGDIRVLSDSCSDTSEDKDDVSINVTVEHLQFVSPLGKFKCTINSWQKGDFLGSGSFGTVYEGFTDDGIFFAVKEVSLLDQGNQGKQSIYQLEQEIFFLSQFEHENIVQYLGTDKDNGKLYIFLELVTKGSLASLYQKYNLQDSQVSAYTRQILNGLNYLHLRKVVHRDIKCANILVDASGSVKLADFGLAKTTNLNDVKSCKGTAFWMAPEVVNRKNHGYGLAADIWSFGCTVLEMLTRRIPYSHLEGMQALFRIGKGEPPPIPNSLSSEARDFISKCLQVNPDDRPTAAQLLDHPFVKRPLPTFSAPASPFHLGGRS